jgi:hypothetical protein
MPLFRQPDQIQVAHYRAGPQTVGYRTLKAGETRAETANICAFPYKKIQNISQSRAQLL